MPCIHLAYVISVAENETLKGQLHTQYFGCLPRRLSTLCYVNVECKSRGKEQAPAPCNGNKAGTTGVDGGGAMLEFDVSVPRNGCEVRSGLSWSRIVSDSSGSKLITKGLSRAVSVGGRSV